MKNVTGKLLLTLCCAGIVFAAAGADNGSEPKMRRGRRNGSREQRGMRGGQRGNMAQMMFGRILAEEKMATAAPEKFAALEAAREKYEAELAALARETGVELPVDRDSSLRKIRKQFPAEFSAVLKKMESDPRQAMTEMQQLAEKAGVKLNSFRGAPDRSRKPGADSAMVSPRTINRPNLDELRRKYPEKMQRYYELRRTDSKAASQLLREIIEQDRKAQ